MLATGTVTVTCTKNGKTVTLHENCVNCTSFRHWGMHGAKIYVACSEEEEQKPKNKSPIKREEDAEFGGLKRWDKTNG